MFDNHFDLVNSFTDPTIPARFAPFDIHNIGGDLYVTYAKQGPDKPFGGDILVGLNH